MNLSELRERPTTIGTGPNGQRIHESVMRSHGMLMKVRELLMQPERVPASVLLEMIDDVMDSPHITQEV